MKKFLFFSLIALVSSALVFNACKKDEDIVLPPIGGFNNSNEVGSADLVAHFPCDEAKERISGTAAASSVNATYVTGLKGKCVSLNAGYVLYGSIPAMTTSTASYSMSSWVQLKNNGGVTNVPTMVASLTRSDDWIGNFNILVETGAFSAASDTMRVKGLFRSNEAGGNQNHDSVNLNGGDPNFKGAGDTSWTQIVITYDATNSTFRVYGNGVKISNPDYEVRGTVADLVFETPTQMLLGAFATNLPGRTADAWQTPMTGKIDEVRVWKKSLSAAEIDALYQLEKAGR